VARLRGAQLVASTHLEQHVSCVDEVRVSLISNIFTHTYNIQVRRGNPLVSRNCQVSLPDPTFMFLLKYTDDYAGRRTASAAGLLQKQMVGRSLRNIG
jgi:hypothetical protein